MAVGTKKTEPLLPQQLAEMLALANQSDSVELKLTVPDTDQRSAITALNMDPLEAQVRQVFFFDTPDLTLNKKGVVVRARRVQGRAHDSVVKLRPVVPDMLPAKIRTSPNMVTEVDAMPGG
ncbi:MAG: adenylate cyclase, partial [Acidimicrobiia bacterium]|nr:adenylate cyclase [Acidimicrobiia bacterium]